ncbi:MAG TPA: protein-glutamate O-methyltransferase CheR [Rariglobus sp.]
MNTPVLAETETLRLSPQCFHRLAELITRRLGIKMPDNKISMLQSRLQRRLRALGLASYDEYMTYLLQSADGERELAEFFDAVTTNKTDFFREPQHFDFLRRTALPALDHAPHHPWHVKLWCAGCSTGEEPYTLAMVLSEHAASREGFDFSILATDISTHVLQTATEGIYDAARIEPVDEGLRKKYLLRGCTPGSRLIRVVPELRARVRFHALNFMDAAYGLSDVFDAIFFRNVMIYFDKATQQAVVEKLCARLRPGGYLFIGHSESLIGLELPLHMVAAAVYQKPSSGA